MAGKKPLSKKDMSYFGIRDAYIQAAEQVTDHIDAAYPRIFVAHNFDDYRSCGEESRILLTKQNFLASELRAADHFRKMECRDGVDEIWFVREIKSDRRSKSFLLLCNYFDDDAETNQNTKMVAVQLEYGIADNRIISAKVMDLLEYQELLIKGQSTPPVSADLAMPFRTTRTWSRSHSVEQALNEPRLP